MPTWKKYILKDEVNVVVEKASGEALEQGEEGADTQLALMEMP